MGQPPPRVDLRTLAGFAAIVVFAGLNFVAVRFSNRELPPFWGATFRFGLATAILFVVVFALRVPLPRGAALRAAIVYGLLVFAAGYALAYWALVFVSAGVGAVVFALLPLVTLFMAVAIGLERLRVRSMLGAAVALAGTGVIFLDQLQADVAVIPMLALGAAVACSAAGGVVLKRSPRTHPFATNAVGMAMGTAGLGLASLLAGESHPLPGSAATWAAVIWLIISTIGLFGLYVWVLARWTASATAYAIVLAPLVTFVAAFALAAEVITVLFIVGSLIVLAGVYLGALSRPTQRPAERAEAQQARKAS